MSLALQLAKCVKDFMMQKLAHRSGLKAVISKLPKGRICLRTEMRYKKIPYVAIVLAFHASPTLAREWELSPTACGKNLGMVNMYLSQAIVSSTHLDSKTNAELAKTMCAAGCRPVCKEGLTKSPANMVHTGNSNDDLKACTEGNVDSCLNLRKSKKDLSNYQKDIAAQAAWAIPCERNGGVWCLESAEKLVAAKQYYIGGTLYWVGCQSGNQDSCTALSKLREKILTDLDAECAKGDARACSGAKKLNNKKKT